MFYQSLETGILIIIFLKGVLAVTQARNGILRGFRYLLMFLE